MTNLPHVLTHRVDGEGEPLLLLNGGMMSLAAWEPVAARLRERFQVIRCDFRGQFLSPGPPPATMEGHADDVARLLSHLGAGAVHVVGASFGAYVALLLAARAPERVASVVATTVTDTVEDELGEGGKALRAACRGALTGGDKAVVYDLIVESAYSVAWRKARSAELAARRAQAALLPDIWFAGLLGLLSALERCDLRPVLGRIACPVLVLAAGADAVMPLQRVEAVAQAIPRAELRLLPECGHALLVEREEEFLRLIFDFIARVGAPGGAA